MTKPNEALLAGLAAHAVELENTAKDLREAYRFSRWLKATIVIGIILIAGLVGIAFLNLRNGSAIRSCTTPGGECFERGQASTAAAVAQIVQAINAHTDLVLTCDRRTRTSAQFQRCINTP